MIKSAVRFVIRHSCFVILFVVVGGLVSCKKARLTNAHIAPNGPVEVVVPAQGAYTGAFMDFGDEEDDVTLEIHKCAGVRAMRGDDDLNRAVRIDVRIR